MFEVWASIFPLRSEYVSRAGSRFFEAAAASLSPEARQGVSAPRMTVAGREWSLVLTTSGPQTGHACTMPKNPISQSL